jgi:hypothetical protein
VQEVPAGPTVAGRALPARQVRGREPALEVGRDRPDARFVIGLLVHDALDIRGELVQ